MSKKFKAKYDNGYQEIPYTRKFQDYGETWVLHREPGKGFTDQYTGIKRDIWTVSHYPTGVKLPFGFIRQNKALEKFDKTIQDAGIEKLKNAVARWPIVNY